MSDRSASIRSSRLRNFFANVLSGKQPITLTNARLFIEAICDQPDPGACIQRLVGSAHGFPALQSAVRIDTVEIQQKNGREFNEVHGEIPIEIWRFMRHHSQEIMTAQQACLRRHEGLRQEIELCLKYSSSYPWVLLTQLNADKFFSDIIESVLGAIFVDSKGSLAQCQRFVERIGILPYLLRITTGDIEVVHPKTVLGLLTGSQKIEYIVGCEGDVYRCVVRINDVDFIAVGECLTKDEAIVRAADAAVKLISGTNP